LQTPALLKKRRCRFGFCLSSPCDAAGAKRPAGETGEKLSAANLFRPPGGRSN
jgi:hypothetical protein